MKKVILIILVFAFVVSGYFGLSVLYTNMNYNPEQEEKFLYTSSNEVWQWSTLLSIYIGMTYPGIGHYAEHYENTCDYKNKGFGNYEYSTKLQKTYKDVDITAKDNIIFYINQSKLTYDELTKDDLLVTYSGVFQNLDKVDIDKNAVINETHQIVEKVKQLPDSSLIDASISFSKKKSANEVLPDIKKSPYSTYTYLALGFEDGENEFYGMSLKDLTQLNLTSSAQKKYPHLFIENRNDVDEETLKQSYLSKLKLLIDHPDFIELISPSSLKNNISIEKLRNRYDSVNQDFSIYGIKGLITKQELLTIISENDLCSVHIDEVKLSSFS